MNLGRNKKINQSSIWNLDTRAPDIRVHYLTCGFIWEHNYYNLFIYLALEFHGKIRYPYVLCYTKTTFSLSNLLYIHKQTLMNQSNAIKKSEKFIFIQRNDVLIIIRGLEYVA